jgi:hypothetical protein
MNEKVKQMWVTALTSGEFVQGQKRLMRNMGDHIEYCCLGVLCELHRREFNFKWENEYYFGAFIILPLEVMAWAGLEEYNPDIKCNGDVTSLAHMNDIGYSFTDIANMIEENL